ncbi:MAG: hypothetical protein MI745_09590 [Pseudomonadales bacterium]|nr:hypothetical protein [Pseudomonadales bacterium]
MTVWDAVEPVLTLGLSVSSLVVASIALNESARNGEAQRRHNRLSVRPILHVTTRWHAGRGGVSYSVENNGVGPAILTDIKIYSGDSKGLGGVDYPLLIISRLMPEGWQDHVTSSITRFDGAYTIPAGTSVELFGLTIDEDHISKFYPSLRRAFDKTFYPVLTYENIYGDSETVINP